MQISRCCSESKPVDLIYSLFHAPNYERFFCVVTHSFLEKILKTSYNIVLYKPCESSPSLIVYIWCKRSNLFSALGHQLVIWMSMTIEVEMPRAIENIVRKDATTNRQIINAAECQIRRGVHCCQDRNQWQSPILHLHHRPVRTL